MKKIVLSLLMLLVVPAVWAQTPGHRGKRMSIEQFRERQKEHLTKMAELTPEEAEAFFPVYFELQDKVRAVSESAWDLFRKGMKVEQTSLGYNEILDGFSESSLQIARLEKSYLEKFKKILPSQKIYKIKAAEMGFRRDFVRDFRPDREESFHRGGGRPGPSFDAPPMRPPFGGGEPPRF